MPFVLNTAELPAVDRVEAIHTAMLEASAPCHVIHEDPDGDVHALMGVWDLGAAEIFTNRASGIRLLRTAKQAKQDVEPVVALSVQQLAKGRHEQLSVRQVITPGELMAVDLSAPYEFSWSGNGAAGCVQIRFEQLGLPLDVIRRAVRDLRASPLYRLFTDHVTHLSRDADRLSTDPGATALGTATVELARALLISAAHPDRHARAVLHQTLLTRVRAYVRGRLTDPDLRPPTIAAAHNVSLRYLYKICADAVSASNSGSSPNDSKAPGRT
ncbi:AraC-like ligand-binding domain-containing protein [Saccharothrix stipae]